MLDMSVRTPILTTPFDSCACVAIADAFESTANAVQVTSNTALPCFHIVSLLSSRVSITAWRCAQALTTPFNTGTCLCITLAYPESHPLDETIAARCVDARPANRRERQGRADASLASRLSARARKASEPGWHAR